MMILRVTNNRLQHEKGISGGCPLYHENSNMGKRERDADGCNPQTKDYKVEFKCHV